jgi:hypothetical protein
MAAAMKQGFMRMDVIDDHRVVLANCGDQPAPLSSDKLERIEAAGGASSFGREQTCLASSAGCLLSTTTIPEVMVTDRAEGDACMILANDGLWDMVTHSTTCKVGFKMSFSKKITKRAQWGSCSKAIFCIFKISLVHLVQWRARIGRDFSGYICAWSYFHRFLADFFLLNM